MRLLLRSTFSIKGKRALSQQASTASIRLVWWRISELQKQTLARRQQANSNPYGIYAVNFILYMSCYCLFRLCRLVLPSRLFLVVSLVPGILLFSVIFCLGLLFFQKPFFLSFFLPWLVFLLLFNCFCWGIVHEYIAVPVLM